MAKFNVDDVVVTKYAQHPSERGFKGVVQQVGDGWYLVLMQDGPEAGLSDVIYTDASLALWEEKEE